MEIGYPGKLYILAFDHRRSLQTKMFGIAGEPTPAETARIQDAKLLIFEGVLAALDRGVDRSVTGVLVDEQFGGTVPAAAKAHGLNLAVAVEKSGQAEFDFEHGEAFGERIEAVDPDFTKVLVRYNVGGDRELNARQLARLRRLSDRLHERGRKLLFELIVPPERHQLEAAGGDPARYDAEQRPALMVDAMRELQAGGVEPDVWKIEGLEDRAACERVAAQARSEGRSAVGCVVLGRGSDDAKVAHWLRQAAPVGGFSGFAIGRSIWWDPVAKHLEGSLDRARAADQVADNYVRFVSVYEDAA